jgi:hypothetical protein
MFFKGSDFCEKIAGDGNCFFRGLDVSLLFETVSTTLCSGILLLMQKQCYVVMSAITKTGEIQLGLIL